MKGTIRLNKEFDELDYLAEEMVKSTDDIVIIKRYIKIVKKVSNINYIIDIDNDTNLSDNLDILKRKIKIINEYYLDKYDVNILQSDSENIEKLYKIVDRNKVIDDLLKD